MNTIKHSKTSVLASVLAATLTLTAAGSALAADAPNPHSADAISLQQAISIARQQTGAEPTEAEREMTMGKPVYDVELVAAQGKEFKVRIDATTGDIIRKREKVEHDRDDIQEQADWLAGIASGQYLSLDSALTKAQQEQTGQVYEIELSDDFGIHYKAKFIQADGSKTKVTVPAAK
ncbi:PepSY domain-containing protein [Shewanella sp. GXUN23E]|uniref:PepSY domain-containing protein n=1 Tax=Shewanella sp. GXUN23E TaxID=3422498 RepID=UPI003D7EF34F